MHIKRFREKTIECALKCVRETFGEDAVILSTKKFDKGVEVLAAIDFDADEIEKKLIENSLVRNELGNLRQEMSDIKLLFSSLSNDSAMKKLAGLESGAIELYQEMLKRGIHNEVSKKLIKAAAGHGENGGGLMDRCHTAIMNNTSVCNPLAEGGKPKLLAFVGPTGVGKTTTVAKLAGKLIQKYKAKVGLVSTDNIRTGANEVLQSCGRQFGISVHAVKSKDDFNKAVWNNKDKDVVLIDTPGRNPMDADGIKEFKGMLAGGLPIKTAIVLSVTTKDDVLLKACDGFGALPLDCMVFTKIDESQSFGSILNTSMFVKKPIAYLCNGQKIPHDIMAASLDMLGNLILGKGKNYV
ncbi:MAG: hypothetical protein HZC45_06070 [Deltaproteobacteria bacterium]|nr:hypothetical protein [Deltaproteobacteria bacterium]